MIIYQRKLVVIIIIAIKTKVSIHHKQKKKCE